jgi:1-acyl-sn-glycerol-3-phosphate acyltransferase
MDFVVALAKWFELIGKIPGELGSLSASPELKARVDRIPTRLGSHGVDAFGFNPESLKCAVGLGAWFYEHYFRCDTYGVNNIPDGRCFIISNHSGQLPFDGGMLSMAAFLERDPPRFLRSMVERFVPSLPFVSTFLTRCGQILGTPENCRRLLENGEAILVFPEGVRGLNKTWEHRYRLQRFGQGFMRLALETNTPIVPAAVIGAEEQAPSLFNVKSLGSLLGLPAVPITPTFPLVPGLGMLPYPTKYRIYFGEPMTFHGNADDEDAAVLDRVQEVHARIQAMIDEGLAKRKNVFW